MYILGKGSIAAQDLVNCINNKIQDKGVLYDDSYPSYCLDFATHVPSISKGIYENNTLEIEKILLNKLHNASKNHKHYISLCVSSHQLLEKLMLTNTIKNISLVDIIKNQLSMLPNGSKVAFLGTQESLTFIKTKINTNIELVNLLELKETIGDLILSIKRGYDKLDSTYPAYPRVLFKKILNKYMELKVEYFLIACTDLHICKSYLLDNSIKEEKIIDIIELTADTVIAYDNKNTNDEGLNDTISDEKTFFRYKYLNYTDSLHLEEKLASFTKIASSIFNTNIQNKKEIFILDIGSSSTTTIYDLVTKDSKLKDIKKIHLHFLDISQASINKLKSLFETIHYDKQRIKISFYCTNILDFQPIYTYDIILCLGLFLYISNNNKFENTVNQLGSILNTNGVLCTRDPLTVDNKKIYLKWGGVIRETNYYNGIFLKNGLTVNNYDDLIIKSNIERNIRTTLFIKN